MLDTERETGRERERNKKKNKIKEMSCGRKVGNIHWCQWVDRLAKRILQSMAIGTSTN